jgi:hypothetical protein
MPDTPGPLDHLTLASRFGDMALPGARAKIHKLAPLSAKRAAKISKKGQRMIHPDPHGLASTHGISGTGTRRLLRQLFTCARVDNRRGRR